MENCIVLTLWTEWLGSSTSSAAFRGCVTMGKPLILSGPWLLNLCCKEAGFQGFPRITLLVNSLILSFNFD